RRRSAKPNFDCQLHDRCALRDHRDWTRRPESTTSVADRSMRALLAVVALLVLNLCGVGTYRSGHATQLEVRLVAQGEGGTEMHRFFGDEVLRVEDTVLLSAAQVREAQLETFPDDTRHIVLYFDEAGTERLATITR